MKTLALRVCAFARVIFFLFLVAPAAPASRLERRIDTWQPTHYAISITLNDTLSEIATATARINIRFLKPTRVIDLDFGELTVDRVSLDSQPLAFAHKHGELLIDLPSLPTTDHEITVTVVYHGKPKDGLILTADKYGKATAVGDNWPNRVHHWIPTFDHPSAKATVSFTITAPVAEEVVANGRLDHVETTASGQRTWTYSEGVPIPPYCMIIAVGQFARLEPTGPTVTPLSYYVPLAERDLAVKGFSPAGPSLDFFTQNVAAYPYEKLALIVGATRFGGMENSSAIVFTSNLFDRAAPRGPSKTFGVPLNNVNVIAHEIAHQWFGDSVTESTWSDLWLSEGFATYFAGLFVQRYEGEDAFQAYLKDAAATVFRYEKEKRMPIFDRDTEDLMQLLNANNYQKGAWVLHMLRARLGDFSFYRGIRAYYTDHRNSTATTEDLRRAFERVSRNDLRPFFTRWVYDSGHPQYELSWQWSRGQLRLVLKQLQPGAAFVDPLPLTITTGVGKRDLVLKPVNKQLRQTISLSSTPVRIEVDPGNTLLKEATVKPL